MRNTQSEIVIIYDIRQLPLLKKCLEERSEVPRVLSLDAEVDSALARERIQYISGRDHRPKDDQHYLDSETWLAFLESPEWDWFSYRNVPLGTLFYPVLQGYLRTALYTARILLEVLQTLPEVKRLIALAPAQQIPISGGEKVRRDIFTVIDVTHAVANGKGIAFETYGRINEEPPAVHSIEFELKRFFFGLGLAVLNFFTNRIRPRGKVRILASDYWRNIAPIMPHLHGPELFLFDRKEVFNLKLKNAWRYRTRFLSLTAYRSRTDRRAREKALTLLKQHNRAVPGDMHVGAVSLKPLVEDLLKEVMDEWIPPILEKIDELYALIDTLRPDIVLLRATVSHQWHFPLLALIAKEHGIPSLELLHGMEYLGPGAFDKRHLAEFVGVYGRFIQRQMEGVGFSKMQVPIIGSPRFDRYELEAYAKARKERSGSKHPFTVFCTAPDVFIGGSFDTYDIEEYFAAVANAVRGLTDIHVLIKLRPGRTRETFYLETIRRIFKDIPHTVAQFEPLRELFPKATIAVSCQTTVTLEALQCGVPLVVYGGTPVEKRMLTSNFTEAANRGAVKLVSTQEELSRAVASLQSPEEQKTLTTAASTYLEQEFAFDGKAGLRAANVIMSVTSRKGTSATMKRF